jgi:hypothetical protein
VITETEFNTDFLEKKQTENISEDRIFEKYHHKSLTSKQTITIKNYREKALTENS